MAPLALLDCHFSLYLIIVIYCFETLGRIAWDSAVLFPLVPDLSMENGHFDLQDVVILTVTGVNNESI